METSPNSNKEIAISFLRMVTSGKIREAYGAHVGADFCHHNPYFTGDAESLMQGMMENEKQFPQKIYEMHHVVAEGEMVAVHGHVRFKKEDAGIAVVHLFRIVDDRIVELWDVGQAIPAENKNENGMF